MEPDTLVTEFLDRARQRLAEVTEDAPDLIEKFSPAYIRRECLKIQREWSPAERAKRAGTNRNPPLIPRAYGVSGECPQVPTEAAAFTFFLRCGNDDPMEPFTRAHHAKRRAARAG